MGSEMCIRDRTEDTTGVLDLFDADYAYFSSYSSTWLRHAERYVACLLYTSDAADERSSVDLGGRRIIKKKNSRKQGVRHRRLS